MILRQDWVKEGEYDKFLVCGDGCCFNWRVWVLKAGRFCTADKTTTKATRCSWYIWCKKTVWFGVCQQGTDFFIHYIDLYSWNTQSMIKHKSSEYSWVLCSTGCRSLTSIVPRQTQIGATQMNVRKIYISWKVFKIINSRNLKLCWLHSLAVFLFLQPFFHNLLFCYSFWINKVSEERSSRLLSSCRHPVMSSVWDFKNT